MAWIERRGTAASPSFRVVWRQGDLGKQQQTFRTRAEADELREAVDRAGQRWPRNFIPGRGWKDQLSSDVPPFREYAPRTIDARPKADARTKADYKAMAERHLYPVIGDKPLDEIDRFDIAAVARRMVNANRSNKTIGNVHALLSSVLADAVADEHVRRNVARGAMPELPDAKTEDMVFLSHADFALIADCLPAGRDRDLARLLVGTGLRWSEATALQVRDVDLLGRRDLAVRRAWKLRDGHYELGEPKTRRSRRTLALSDELVNLLTPYAADLDDESFLFRSEHGRPVRHSNFRYRAWVPALFASQNCAAHRKEKAEELRTHRLRMRAAKRANVTFDEKAPAPCGCPGTLRHSPRIHDLRHTHASWLIADKVSLVAVQRRLGHESIQTTIDRYSHLAPEHVDEINASVDRALARG